MFYSSIELPPEQEAENRVNCRKIKINDTLAKCSIQITAWGKIVMSEKLVK